MPSSEIVELGALLFGLFAAGFTAGILISAYKRFMSSI